MASEGVLEPVNVVANGLVGFLTGVEDGAPDELGFQGLKERLHHGIVVAIPFAGHRDQDAMLAELGLMAYRHRDLGLQRSRSPAVISPLPSGRRSHFCESGATPFERLGAASVGRRRRFPGNCGATLPPEAAAWNTAQPQRNGTPIKLLAGQSGQSLRSTWHCEPMWKNGWLVSS